MGQELSCVSVGKEDSRAFLQASVSPSDNSLHPLGSLCCRQTQKRVDFISAHNVTAVLGFIDLELFSWCKSPECITQAICVHLRHLKVSGGKKMFWLRTDRSQPAWKLPCDLVFEKRTPRGQTSPSIKKDSPCLLAPAWPQLPAACSQSLHGPSGKLGAGLCN